MASATVFTGAQIDADTHRRLHELADRNERSAAAELRLALREHFDRAQVDALGKERQP